jgi:transcriptional regulator with XRE-family HTH domain
LKGRIRRGEVLATLGEYLRGEREKKNLSLKELSKATRIRKRLLEALEGDEHHLLPPAVFVKGFLRLYARELGLHERGVLSRYEDFLSRDQAEAAERLPSKRRKALFPLAFLVGILVISALMVAYLVISDLRQEETLRPTQVEGQPLPEPIMPEEPEPIMPEEPEPIMPEEPEPIMPEEPEIVLPPSVAGGVSKEAEEEEEVVDEVPGAFSETEALVYEGTEEMSLLFKASQITWIRIQLDEGIPYEVTLRGGESYRVRAFRRFLLRIGNGGGVELFLDGISLGKPGMDAQVVDLVLPDAGNSSL